MRTHVHTHIDTRACIHAPIYIRTSVCNNKHGCRHTSMQHQYIIVSYKHLFVNMYILSHAHMHVNLPTLTKTKACKHTPCTYIIMLYAHVSTPRASTQHLHIHLSNDTHTHTYTHRHTHTHTYTHTHTHTYTRICTHIQTHTHTHVYRYAHARAHTQIHSCTQTYTHIHTHTQICFTIKLF